MVSSASVVSVSSATTNRSAPEAGGGGGGGGVGGGRAKQVADEALAPPVLTDSEDEAEGVKDKPLSASDSRAAAAARWVDKELRKLIAAIQEHGCATRLCGSVSVMMVFALAMWKVR